MTTPAPGRPQPVVDAAKQLGMLVAGAFIAVGVVWFLVVGGINSDNLLTVGTAVGAAVTAVVALAAYVWTLWQARKTAQKVTPLEDPRDHRGVELVPADAYGRHAAPNGDPA